MWPRSDDEYDHRVRLNGHTVELLDEAWHSQVKPKPCRYGSLFDTACFQVIGRGFVSRSCGKGDSTARAWACVKGILLKPLRIPLFCETRAKYSDRLKAAKAWHTLG